MFNFLVRNRHLLHGKFTKEVFDFNSSIPEFRDRCEKGAKKMGKIPGEITIKRQPVQGINAEWIIPEGAEEQKIILYVHGGGYVSGSCSDHRGVVSKFAMLTGITCLLYEYRLAPEHPFPAALDDSVAVYKWLLAAGYTPDNILIAGESAGGGLCLATLLALKEKKIPLPVAAVAISPWTDLTCSSDSYTTKNRMSVAPLNSWTVFSHHYVADNNPRSPLISPLYGDLKGLPPLLINAGMNDELYEDGEKFSTKAGEAGVEVIFTPGIGQVHCYPFFAPMFPEATGAMNEIVDFVKTYLKSPGRTLRQ